MTNHPNVGAQRLMRDRHRGPNDVAGRTSSGHHRVVVPVYIPNTQGYFEHAPEILKLCLDSLHETAQGHVNITVVSNGCVAEVVTLLKAYLDAGVISELTLNGRNWGKIDAALSAVRGRSEPLLTIADADVLFRPGWLHAVEDIFQAFPECGFVTPAPNPSLAFLHTSSTILSAAPRGELGFEAVTPQLDIDRFAQSIGRPDFCRPEQRRVQMTVRRNGAVACVGGGHFVFTMRHEVACQLPRQPSLTALRPWGETTWFDDPPDMMGAWRLATTRAYAYHMGNVPEPWMYEAIAGDRAASPNAARPRAALPPMRRSSLATIPYAWRKFGAHAARRLYFERRWKNAAALAGRGHAQGH